MATITVKISDFKPDTVKRINQTKIGRKWLVDATHYFDEYAKKWNFEPIELLHSNHGISLVALVSFEGKKAIFKYGPYPEMGEPIFSQQIYAMLIDNGDTMPLVYKNDEYAFLIEYIDEKVDLDKFTFESYFDTIYSLLVKCWNKKVDDPTKLVGIEEFKKVYISHVNIDTVQEYEGYRNFLKKSEEYIKQHPYNFCFLHGDVMLENILHDSNKKQYKLIDPIGIYNDPFYDLAIFINSMVKFFSYDDIKLSFDVIAKRTGLDKKLMISWCGLTECNYIDYSISTKEEIDASKLNYANNLVKLYETL